MRVWREREPRFGLVITGLVILLNIFSAFLFVKATPPLATGRPSFKNFIFIMPLLSIHFNEPDSISSGRGRPSKVIIFPASTRPSSLGGPLYSAIKASLIGPI